jgi:hypothetical protein
VDRAWLGIPGVSVVVSMIQIAPRLSLGELERAINQADGQDLIDTEMLRSRVRKAWSRSGKPSIDAPIR